MEQGLQRISAGTWALLVLLLPAWSQAEDSFDGITLNPGAVVVHAPHDVQSRTALLGDDVTCNLIDFEGIGNEAMIGVVPGSPNVSFGTSWLGLIDEDAGGTGNFANEPSPDTIAFFLTPADPIDFDQGVQFINVFYTAGSVSVPVTLTAFDGPGGTGNVVDTAVGDVVGSSNNGADCVGDPTGRFCLWDTLTLESATNNILSIVLSGAAADQFGFDNMTFCTGLIEDCNGNGVPDECDIDCGPDGGICDVSGCGQSDDNDGNGVPDECGPPPLPVLKWQQMPHGPMEGFNVPSDLDWQTLAEQLPGDPGPGPNWVVADDFLSNGKPIFNVRWWGSYVDPAFDPSSGACCLGGGACTDTIAPACEELGGVFIPDTDCNSGPCAEECDGATCKNLPECLGNPECSCFTGFNGAGVCALSTACAPLELCGPDGSCPEGTICTVGTCCQQPDVCIPTDIICTGSALDGAQVEALPPGTLTTAGVIGETEDDAEDPGPRTLPSSGAVSDSEQSSKQRFLIPAPGSAALGAGKQLPGAGRRQAQAPGGCQSCPGVDCDQQVGITGTFSQTCNDGSWISIAWPFDPATLPSQVDSITIRLNTNNTGGDLYIMGGTCAGPDVNSILATVCTALDDQPVGVPLKLCLPKPVDPSPFERMWVVATFRTDSGWFVGYDSATLGTPGAAYANITGLPDPAEWQDLNAFGFGACYCVYPEFNDCVPGGACGNGVVEPGEECEPGVGGQCIPDLCQPDCTCGQCDVVCDPAKLPENEPNCGLDPQGNPDDMVNGGCNVDPPVGPVYSPIMCGDSYCGSAARHPVTGFRDTDWYELVLTQQTTIDWCVDAEFEVLVGVAECGGTGDCADCTGFINPFAIGHPCEQVCVTTTLSPGTWWLFVAPSTSITADCPSEYNASLACKTIGVCGDGVLDPGEECDPGVPGDDTACPGLCLSDCTCGVPGTDIDGWLLSFHTDLPAEDNPDGYSKPLDLLGLYFCPADAVDLEPTQTVGWDGHLVFNYGASLQDCCLLHSYPDPRKISNCCAANTMPGCEDFLCEQLICSSNPSCCDTEWNQQCADEAAAEAVCLCGDTFPAQANAFYENADFVYWLDIQALVGHTFHPSSGCVEEVTPNRAFDHFWGWHTSTQECFDESTEGHVVMGPAGEWIYPDWTVVDGSEHGLVRVDQAFELYTLTTCPADINGDGLVGPFDLALLLGAWGSYVPCLTPEPMFKPMDIDKDFDIDPLDLAFLLGAWGPCP